MSAASVVEAAPAKLNLYLHVVGRRADGYHLLESLVVFASIADRIEAALAPALGLEVTGPFAGALAEEGDNLVLRAARLLAETVGERSGAELRLAKNLPVASGIGGGSSDAAATLRALCRLWNCTPSPAALDEIALRLGADVPVCLRARPMFMSGIGEVVEPAPALPRAGLVLVNSGDACPTAPVFKGLAGRFSAPPPRPDRPIPDPAALAALLRATANDLRDPAVGLVPGVAEAEAALAGSPGCLFARMSGSGATCFGLYPDRAAAAAAADWIARREPRWWVAAGELNP